MPAIGPLAMWLTNEGLQTVDLALTWRELADLIGDLGRAATSLQDPSRWGQPNGR